MIPRTWVVECTENAVVALDTGTRCHDPDSMILDHALKTFMDLYLEYSQLDQFICLQVGGRGRGGSILFPGGKLTLRLSLVLVWGLVSVYRSMYEAWCRDWIWELVHSLNAQTRSESSPFAFVLDLGVWGSRGLLLLLTTGD